MMLRIKKTKVFNLKKMSGDEKMSLAKSVFPVYEVSFDSSGFDGFYDFHFQDEPSEKSKKIAVYYNEGKEVVGFFYLQVTGFNISDWRREVMFLKASAAVLPEYRKNRITTRFALLESLRWKFRYLWRPFFYGGVVLHPAAYYSFCTLHNRVHPSCRHEMPESINHLLHEMGHNFGYNMLEKNGGAVKPRFKSQARLSEKERAFWLNHESPDVQFYLTHVPFADHYSQQAGLLTIYPLTFLDLLTILTNQWRHKRKKK